MTDKLEQGTEIGDRQGVENGKIVFNHTVEDVCWQSMQRFQQPAQLAGCCHAFDEVLQSVLRQVCELTNWDLGEAWLPNADHSLLTCSPVWYSREVERYAEFRRLTETLTFAPGVGLPGRVWQSGTPEWNPDLSGEAERLFLRLPLVLDVELRAGLALPIVVNSSEGADETGGLLAVLVFFMEQAQPEDQKIVALVSAIATQLGSLMQLQQTEAALSESQRRLSTLIDSLPGIAFIGSNDPGWSMTYLSQGCLAMTGYHPEELAGPQRKHSYNDITHPDDVPLVLRAISQAIACKQPYVIEYRIFTKSGEERWVWEKGYGVFDADGNQKGIEGFITDITELKLTEQALRQSQETSRDLLRAIPDLLFLLNEDGRYLHAQAEQEADLVCSLSQHIGRMSEELLPPEIAQKICYYLNQVRLTRSSHKFEYEMRFGETLRYFEAHIAPCGDKTYIYTVRNITERKQAENLLAGQKQVLELIATDAEIKDALDLLVQVVEHQIEGSVGSVLLLNSEGDRLHHCAAPNLPETYICEMDAIPLNHPAFCNAVTYQQEPMIIDDIAASIYEDRYRNLVLAHGLQSCWSVPIRSTQGGVLGLFVLYHRKPKVPDAHYWQVMETATQIAGIAIQRKQSAVALQEAEAKYRSIFENAVEGIFQTSPEGQYRIVNPMLAKLYGYDSPEEVLEVITDIEHQLYVRPNRRSEFVQLMKEQGAVWGFESEVYRKDGSVIWVSECARTIYGPEGELIGFEGTVEDISQRKQTEAELLQRDNLLLAVAEATNCLLATADLKTAIPQALASLGQAANVDRVYLYENHLHPLNGEVAMTICYEWVSDRALPCSTGGHWHNQPYSAHGITRWYEAFCQGKSVQGTIQSFPPEERVLLAFDNILSMILVPIFVEENLWGFIGFDDCQIERQWSASEESILSAIAASLGGAIKRQYTEEQMRHQAFHDVLTGMPNRTFYQDTLDAALASAQQTNELLAVVFLDLDRFKTINDTLGHAVGDRLLQQTTQRLMQCLRQEDVIARWGGDEFTLLLPDLKQPEDAAKIARRINEALKPAFYLDQHELHITSSMGIAFYPYNGTDAETLLKNADAALYRAKEQGRNSYQFYTDAINSQASVRLTLDSSLHSALEREEFVVYYQPQVNIRTGKVIQMEALLRWQHPKLGLVPPQTFISLAEENGLILPIGAWVLRVACFQHKRWQSFGIAPLRMAVNLSARQFQQPDLVQQIRDILQETQLQAQFLELEITETAAMRDVDFTQKMLHDLRRMGVRISMDDFGTGYSSLSYLKKFPLQTLKIDRSFVQDLTRDTADVAIITSIIALGRGLNLTVVAEGVETSEQLEALRSLDCEEMQGYLFSKPMTTEQATQFLQERSP